MYAGVVVMAVAAAPVVAILYALHRIATVSPEPLHLLPFESGWIPAQHALSPYHVRWYLATLLFLAFDVEMLFMYHGSGELAERTLPGGSCPVPGRRRQRS